MDQMRMGLGILGIQAKFLAESPGDAGPTVFQSLFAGGA